MSLRFCTLDFEQMQTDQYNETIARIIFQERGKRMIVLLGSEEQYYGFIDRVEWEKGNLCIRNDSETIGKDFFLKAHDTFFHIGAPEFLPVLDPSGRLLCFCYQDYEIEKMQENILELVTFNKILDFDRCVGHGRFVRIYGFNEIAYYFHFFLVKQGVKHGVYGDMWAYFAKELLDAPCQTGTEIYDFLAEGNFGSPIWEGAYGKVTLEWHVQDYALLYDFYKLNCNYHDVMPREQLQRLLSTDIRSGRPFMLARIGNTEISILKEYLEKQYGVLSQYSEFWVDFLYNCCGFFSNPQGDFIMADIDRYAELTLHALKGCDYQVCWGREDLAAGLNFLLDEYSSPDSCRISWDDLETVACCWDPVTEENALRGKRVLVVSPFTDTIRKQYDRRELLLFGEDEFPCCELILYRAPETQMGNTDGFDNWFQVFDRLCHDIEQIDFDIAIIGAGAYGFPLAARVKSMGKQAISISSYLANWFGIKMKRYCTYAQINRRWNNNWCFVMETPPKGYEKIESGCYWR